MNYIIDIYISNDWVLTNASNVLCNYGTIIMQSYYVPVKGYHVNNNITMVDFYKALSQLNALKAHHSLFPQQACVILHIYIYNVYSF